MKSVPPLPSLVAIEEIAEHLGVTVRHVRLLVAQRRIPYVKWGHLLRFDRDEIRLWIKDAEVHPLLTVSPRRRSPR
jgi:excisionase family DNA binding protein